MTCETSQWIGGCEEKGEERKSGRAGDDQQEARVGGIRVGWGEGADHRMARSRKNLGELLVGWGVVTADQLDAATKTASRTGKRLGEALVEAGYASDEQVAKALAQQLDMEYVDLSAEGVVERIDTKLIPDDLIKKHQVLPFGKANGRLNSSSTTR